MPSTFSQNLRIELIGAGEQSGVWNVSTNRNLGTLIEQAISGVTNLNVTSADITLTALNGVTDQARSAVLNITGTPGTTRTVTIPNVSKTYTVKNRSDATVNLKTASGSPFAIPTLSEAYVYCDSNNVITGRVITDGANAFNANTAPLNDTALTGTPTAPTAEFGTDTTQLATTAFVQAALQAVFPVGSVYINAESTVSPATLFGFGSWEEIGKGQVLVGQDVDDADFDSLAKTGGSKDAVLVSHTHSATVSTESVDHTHSGSTDSQNRNHSHGFSGSTGGAGAHSHLLHFRDAGLGGNQDAVPGSNGNRFLSDANAINGVGDHVHPFSGTTGGVSVNHEHAFSTGGMSANANHSHSVTNSTQGESATGKNLQPYLVVKMWKRVS